MHESDITAEKYQGPGPALTSAGYLYASHLLAVLGGVVVASVAAYFAHGRVGEYVAKTREWGARSGGRVEQWTQSLFGRTPGTHELHGVAGVAGSEKLKELVSKEEKGFFELLAWKFAKWLGKSERAGQFLQQQSEEKLSAVFIGGGLGGAAGWIGSTVWSLFKGHKTGNHGKHQFERAQSEIRELRSRNEDLTKANSNLREAVVRAETRWKDTEAEKPVSEAEVPAKADLSEAAHHGTLAHAPEVAPERA